MKKTIIYLFLFFTSIVISQNITVNTSTYTVPQLVNNILINSPCINATNIAWSTGTNFGSTNGIGYFENTNPNFPLSSGVILSTGNVLNASGPNTTILDDGSPTWPGDNDLENTLAAAGITMNSINATTLEFQFTALSPNFNFKFLFASEEYGNYQCQYSDAFAFLLTNMNTGVTTNLAVVPNTTLPISVVTIRDFLYNSSCTSENEQYFGSFNGGVNASTSPINFNGQTVEMTASSVLTPNVPYKIKLVIADREDVQSDSAIFLSSNSFNFDHDIFGDDLTIASNTAICFGQSHTLVSGLSPSIYTFQWKRNGLIIPGETNPDLVINQPGTYEIVYANIIFPCQTLFDPIIVEYFPEFITPLPNDLYRCDTNSAPYTYDLSLNTPVVTQGLAVGTTVSYHSNLNDATNNSNALPLSYVSSGNQTIYVRINKANTSCFTVHSFQLLIAPAPVATQPQPFRRCENSFGSGVATFNLSSLNPTVLNGLSATNYSVTYYLNLQDATSNTNAIAGSQITTTSTTVYIRLQLNTDSSCYDTTSVDLVVLPLPAVDTLTNVIQCDPYVLPPLNNGNYFTGPNGTQTPLFAGNVITNTQTIYIYNESNSTPTCSNQSSFLVTIVDIDDIPVDESPQCNSYTLPGLNYGNYYTDPSGGGTIIPSGTLIETTQPVYFYYQSPEDPSCVLDVTFTVTIIPTESVVTLNNVFDCTSYTLPPLSFGNYYNSPNGVGLIDPTIPITQTKTIYIYGQSSPLCPASQSQFNVTIGLTAPPDVNECAQYILPSLAVGNYYTAPNGGGTLLNAGTAITSTQDIYIFVETDDIPNCTSNTHFNVNISLPEIIPPSNLIGCYSYTLPNLQVGNYYTLSGGPSTPSNVMLNQNTIIYTTTTLYIYVENTSGCENELPIVITINPRPFIDPRPDIIDICAPDTYSLTPLTNGNYYTGPQGTGDLLPTGYVIDSTQTIYIYYMDDNGCDNEAIINIKVQPRAYQQNNIALCEGSYLLPALPQYNHYYTLPGGPNGGGIEIFPNTPEAEISTTTTLYIYRESNERISCVDESSFTVTIVQNRPVANPIPIQNRTFCDEDGTNDGILDVDLTQFTATILGTQTSPEFTVTYYETLENAVALVNPITSSNLSTVYLRLDNTLAPNCYDIQPITIVINKLPSPQLQDGIICIDSKTGALLKSYLMNSGLSSLNHVFQWFNSAGAVISTQSTYNATAVGTYSFIAINTITGCSSGQIFITVNQSEPATVDYIVEEDFGETQTLTIIATGVGGSYVYSLDNGPYQTSPVFSPIKSGTHFISVKDTNGCGIVPLEVIVINYPRFFTPNNDGANDTWNIKDLRKDTNAIVTIYDRHGKVIVQIKPSGAGWDGFYNKNMMPSDDYWFTVDYSSKGVSKKFKSHFSLKR